MNKEKSIRLLNKGVADELQAVHQYMFFHFHLTDQGFGPLAALVKRIAIQEMGHLAGGPVEKITEPEAILDKAMAMEQDGTLTYNKAALECSSNADSASKQLFEQLVGDEEGHLDQFEQQRDNIKRFGLSYLALQSFGDKTAEGPMA